MEPLSQTPNTGSIQDINLLTAGGDDRHFGILYKKLEELEKKIIELETKKIIEESQLPPEILIANGMVPERPRRVLAGRGWRPLLRSEIEEAIKHAGPFCTDQARYLNVCMSTHRKYAVLHGLWKPQPNHKGSKKPWGPEKGKYPLSKILIGEFDANLNLCEWVVRAKLFKAGTFPEECAHCGYKEKHIITKHVPLLIDHLDGDWLHWKKENIRFLCWNCTVQVGRGFIASRLRKFNHDFIKEGDWK